MGSERRDTIKYMTRYLVDFGALALLYGLVLFKRWRAKGRDVLLVNTLMYLYLSLVLYFTMMPVIASIPFVLNHRYVPMNLAPFIDVSMGRGDFFRQVALNIIMMMPFGFLFPLTQKGARQFSKTVLSCFLLSLGIELLQPFFNRSSDITDLITNSAGGVLGYVLYVIFRPVTVWILDHLCARKGER